MNLWMPTRPSVGEGRVEWGSNRRMNPFRSTGVVGTARWEGGPGNRGRPVSAGGRTSNVVTSTAGHAGFTLELLIRDMKYHRLRKIASCLISCLGNNPIQDFRRPATGPVSDKEKCLDGEWGYYFRPLSEESSSASIAVLVTIIMDQHSVTLRAANPTFEEGLAFARYLDEAAEGFFRFMLGRRAGHIIATAFAQPDHDLSYQYVTFSECDNVIVGMWSGYTAEPHRRSSLQPLKQAAGRRNLRMRVVLICLLHSCELSTQSPMAISTSGPWPLTRNFAAMALAPF